MTAPAGSPCSATGSPAASATPAPTSSTIPPSQIVSETRTNDDYAWRIKDAYARDYVATNGQNQYGGTISDGAPSATFSYDANGNLLSDGTTNLHLRRREPPDHSVGTERQRDARLRSARPAVPGLERAGVTQFLHDGDELVGGV